MSTMMPTGVKLNNGIGYKSCKQMLQKSAKIGSTEEPITQAISRLFATNFLDPSN